MALYMEEVYIDRTRNLRCGESGVFETFTDDRGKLYKSLVKQHGRCISGVFIDKKDGSVKKVGWVFIKRVKYEDCNETYLQEVWVSLHTAPPTVTKQEHFLELPA